MLALSSPHLYGTAAQSLPGRLPQALQPSTRMRSLECPSSAPADPTLLSGLEGAQVLRLEPFFLTGFECPQVLGLKPALSSAALNPTAAEFIPGGLPPALAAKISAVNEQLRNPSAAPSMPSGPANASTKVQSRPSWLQHMYIYSLHTASADTRVLEAQDNI